MKKAYEASKYAEKSAYISVASAVATVYYNLVNIDELLKLQKEIVELKEENLKLVFLKAYPYKKGKEGTWIPIDELYVSVV